jgi:hypothetical protein
MCLWSGLPAMCSTTKQSGASSTRSAFRNATQSWCSAMSVAVPFRSARDYDCREGRGAGAYSIAG